MTKTIHTHVGVDIARSPDDVWAAVSDYANDLRWRKGITEMTPDAEGAPRVGTNVREVLQLAGREYITDTTVTQVGPDLSYRFAGSGTGGAVRGRRRVVAGTKPGSSVFTYDIAVDPEGIPTAARPALAWWLRHNLRRDLRRLRRQLETAA